MGNKLGRRHAVDEKFTRPQGLYQHKDVDHKKLRKLILDSKLAPCYPGEDDNASDLEECPICFLYYPSLNRSRCCMKGICTECFLQMKTPNSNRPTQCPFCKTSNYAVEYRGVKTKEEKGLEQLEEQRVIEAKIRMRQKEIVDDEERILKQREMSSSSRRGPAEVEYTSIAAPSVSSPVDEIVDAHEWDTAGSIRPLPWQRQNRENDFDIDLEDIMVMEAVWLSIQESGRHRDPASCDAAHSEEDVADDGRSTTVMTPASGPSSSSPSSGLACAIAALAERQQMNGETSIKYTGDVSSYSTPCCSQYRQGQEPANYFQADGAVTTSNDPGQWMDRRSEVTELGTSYGGYDESEDATSQAEPPHQGNEGQSGLQAQQIESAIVPESFEEQMMLAMAVSLAEARTRSSTPGIAWH